MMITLGSYLRRFRRQLRRIVMEPKLQLPMKAAGCFLVGFCLSAASLGSHAQPLVLGLLCAPLSGWLPIPIGLGAALGYWLFWGSAGLQGIAWTAVGLPLCVALGQRRVARQEKLLMPSLAALTVAACGVVFQTWFRDDTAILMYLLRIGAAFGSTWLFSAVWQRREPMADWAAIAIGVLALAQIAPLPFLGLGFVAAGGVAAALPFPAVALAGLALDVAQVTPVPMAAVLCLVFAGRLIPKQSPWLTMALPPVMYLVVMGLCGMWDLAPLAGLFLGACLGVLLPERKTPVYHRGPTGVAQVRLELAAGVMAQTEELLLDVQELPIDEEALMVKAAERACGTCPCRKGCKDLEQAKALPAQLLHRPIFTVDDLSVTCKKRGRLMVELRRCQDQYRILKADRDRRREYHGAVMQQYRFLTEYLQDLADDLPRKADRAVQRFQPEIAVCSAGKEQHNGDRCSWFAGTELKYYVLLCDGMGTGTGAAEEAQSATQMLRKLLLAGFPAPYALRSLNSLCTLRGIPGAVSVDLAEISLDSGKTVVYKWGAAPSLLLHSSGVERIGTAGTPPGLTVTGAKETVDRLSLRRGETLVLLSDGVDGEAAFGQLQQAKDPSPGELAAVILETGGSDGADDATAAVVRLHPVTVST